MYVPPSLFVVFNAIDSQEERTIETTYTGIQEGMLQHRYNVSIPRCEIVLDHRRLFGWLLSETFNPWHDQALTHWHM